MDLASLILFLGLAGMVGWLSMLTLTLAAERRATRRALDELTVAIAALAATSSRVEPPAPSSWSWSPPTPPPSLERRAEVDRNCETLSDRRRAPRILA